MIFDSTKLWTNRPAPLEFTDFGPASLLLPLKTNTKMVVYFRKNIPYYSFTGVFCALRRKGENKNLGNISGKPFSNWSWGIKNNNNNKIIQ